MIALFTFHGHGTWLPDRPQGYVRRHEGVLPPDPRRATQYRRQMKSPPVHFDTSTQRIIIDTVLASRTKQHFEALAIATEATHTHILVSWEDSRTVEKVSGQIKTSITRALNARIGRRKWLAKDASRRRIADAAHLEHLTARYLPDHTGVKWDRDRGWY